MNARDEILAKVQAAMVTALPGPIPRDYRRTDPRGRDELVDLFVERTVDYGAQVVRTSTPTVAIARILQKENATAVAVPASLPRAWRPAWGQLIDDDGLSPRRLDRIGAALTGCTLAISETGTIVLASADGRRALTLVPDLHICVVREVQVVATLPLAFGALDPVARCEPLTFVSGPSATSDIELRRVQGVHGPRRLAVVIVP